MDFSSIYAHGFARVAACTVPVALADPSANVEPILAAIRTCHEQGVAVAGFADLCLTGATAGDLLVQDAVLDAVDLALTRLLDATADLRPLVIVGAPIRWQAAVYDCAVVMQGGRPLGVVPKSHPATAQQRWFAPGSGIVDAAVAVAGVEVPFGTDLLFPVETIDGLVVHPEFGDDAVRPSSPGALAATAGATVLVTLTAEAAVLEPGTAGAITASASRQNLAAHIHAAAGPGESSTDAVYDGAGAIYECGDSLASGDPFPDGIDVVVADIDLRRIRHDRRLRGGPRPRNGHRTVALEIVLPAGDIGLQRPVQRFPFVPADPDGPERTVRRAYEIQVRALVRRMRSMGEPKIVLGVSGGLDSTHALIVAAKAMDRLGRPRSEILAYTMPGFASSDRSKNNALRLAEGIGATAAELDIRPVARQLLADIGHPFAADEPVYDVTFENVQAGARTDLLFRLANQHGGFVLGTGDLSELAMGWCTYGVGDHMSHYGVNAGVPKTLMQHLVRWVAASGEFGHDVSALLDEIVGQPITPELIPEVEGVEKQTSEATIGPYPLVDFAVYHVLRYGASASRIAFLAHHAWGDPSSGPWPENHPDRGRLAYDPPAIRHWLEVFGRRFFALSQFKRSVMTDGPQVVPAGSLSPRGGWTMPSDSTAAGWLGDLEHVPGGDA